MKQRDTNCLVMTLVHTMFVGYCECPASQYAICAAHRIAMTTANARRARARTRCLDPPHHLPTRPEIEP